MLVSSFIQLYKHMVIAQQENKKLELVTNNKYFWTNMKYVPSYSISLPFCVKITLICLYLFHVFF